MKTEFTVTIKGSWLNNGKRVAVADIEKELREAVKERFEFLADRVTVKRASKDAA